jgi:hypothetical protein
LRIALPILGGMVSTTLLTLIVTPAIKTRWRRIRNGEHGDGKKILSNPGWAPFCRQSKRPSDIIIQFI